MEGGEVNIQQKNSDIEMQSYIAGSKTLSFIGIRHMGRPIAMRLLNRGYRVIVKRAIETVGVLESAAFSQSVTDIPICVAKLSYLCSFRFGIVFDI
jgi:hypothetical protein